MAQENFKQYFFQAENTVRVLLQYSLCCGFADAFVLFQQHLYLMVILNLIPAWWKLLHLCMVIWWRFRKAIAGCSRFQRYYTYLQSSNNVLCTTLHWWECDQINT